MRIQQTGLLEWDRDRATSGFTLFSPNQTEDAYLLDMAGTVVHQWKLVGKTSGYARLLPNGNLLSAVCASVDDKSREAHRVVREYDWDGNVVWQCDAPAQHHDFRRRPNGNTAFLGFEQMRPENVKRVQGGIPGSEIDGTDILGDYIHEVAPDGTIAWEWHAQDDMEIENYPIHPSNPREEFAHANALFDLPNGDYLVSFRRNSWLFIIDRQTRKVRWERQDDSWGGQHDCQMLENGNILFFANGLYAPKQLPSSRVIEMDPATGDAVWTYAGSPPWTFFSPHISGAQRLWSGNTLICEGLWGRIFEVTPEGEIVWEYISPYETAQAGPMAAGRGNWVFRAHRYAADGPEIAGRVAL